MNIGVVNYSLGNVGSVLSAFDFYHYDVSLIDTARGLRETDMIVLAGVGNFPTALHKLKALRLWDELNEQVLVKKKPVLGICLGMQLFADLSFEDGETEGFGWIPGKVEKMPAVPQRIPHIGWNVVRSYGHPLFNDMKSDYFYFMHSYRFLPNDRSSVIAETSYGDLSIVSAVCQDNICGVQFHPEKSQGNGLRLLKNLVEMTKLLLNV